MTASTLRSYTIKDLAQLAKRRGVNGWHSMRKDQLVRALSRIAKAKSPEAKPAKKPGSRLPREAAKPGAAAGDRGGLRRTAARNLAKRSQIAHRIEQAKAHSSRSKNLAFDQPAGMVNGAAKDRLVAMVRGPYWLHAYWELTAQGIARAQAALGREWHHARPMLRLLMVAASGNTTTSERILRDIPIHGGVRNWYIDLENPSQTYRLEIGYLGVNQKFFSLARSNVVTTPAAAGSDSLDVHWNDVLADCDKIYAMSGGFATEGSNDLQELFEERLRRPMGAPNGNRYGSGVDGLLPRDHNLRFHVEAEIVIHGTTHADAQVSLQGEPLKLRPDGTFSVRLDMPNRRQVIPIVASTKDGVEQRTIVLAIERNTKVMEPLTRDSGE